VQLGSNLAGVQYGWDNSRAPTRYVPSGAVEELELHDASDGQIRAGATATAIPQMDRSRGNPLVGPIHVEGARAGRVLQVDILEIVPGDWGWTGVFPGFGLLADDFQKPALMHWSLTGKWAESAWLRLRQLPFCGVLGVCLREPGTHSSVPPRHVGGNLDIKQLGAGSTLFLPVEVDGALFGAGDTHARQGDGEVCGSALETTGRVTLRLTARNDLTLRSPEFITSLEPQPASHTYTTTGIGPDLYGAAQDAVRRMIDYVCRTYTCPSDIAYMLCSVLVDLRISEIVDQPNWVVTAHWPLEP
jgi:acetamidase/formamidase